MPFVRRPGGSPAIAALLAAGVLHRNARILDLCCGEGEDALLLACGGVRSVVGVDADAAKLKVARQAAKRHGVDGPAKFVTMEVPMGLQRFPASSFDVVVDTLGLENAVSCEGEHEASERVRESRERRLVAAIARLLSDDGMWIAHVRDDHHARRPYRPRRAVDTFPSTASTLFEIGAAYPTHLAEYHKQAEDDGDEIVEAHGAIYFCIARRRLRRS